MKTDGLVEPQLYMKVINNFTGKCKCVLSFFVLIACDKICQTIHPNCLIQPQITFVYIRHVIRQSKSSSMAVPKTKLALVIVIISFSKIVHVFFPKQGPFLKKKALVLFHSF